MNDRRKMEIKVGALVVVSITAVFLFIWLLGDFSFGPTAEFHADFDHTGGLKVGAPVMMSGVEIGKVSEIGLVRHQGRPATVGKVGAGNTPAPGTANGAGTIGKPGVRITASIPLRDFNAIPSDISVSIAARSVLGEKHLELTPGPGQVAPLRAGAILDGRPPAGLEKAGDDAVSLIRQVSKFLDENDENLSSAITEIRELSAGANDLLKTNRPRIDEAVENLRVASQRLAAEVQAGGRVNGMLSRADRIVKRLDDATTDVGTDLPALVKNVDAMATRADRMITNLDKLVVQITDPTVNAVTRISDITEGIDKGRGTVGKLVAEQELYDDIRAFVKDIKAHPWKILWKK